MGLFYKNIQNQEDPSILRSTILSIQDFSFPVSFELGSSRPIDSTRLWIALSQSPNFFYYFQFFFIGRILNIFHFWGSYKFSLHLRLHLVKTSLIISTYSVWCSIVLWFWFLLGPYIVVTHLDNNLCKARKSVLLPPVHYINWILVKSPEGIFKRDLARALLRIWFVLVLVSP